jgi:hypothetical protein
MKINEIVPDLANNPKNQQSQSSQPSKHRTSQSTQGTQGTQGPGASTNDRSAEHNKDRQIKQGGTVKLRTADGSEQEFKITRDMGNEVEIENPEGRSNPNEPNKLVYDKKQLRRGMSSNNENNRT